jgi:hypothetical protein
VLRIRRKRRRNPAWSIYPTPGHARSHLLPQMNSAFVTFNSFLFLGEDANYVVLPACEHHNARSACRMLQRCCLSYEWNINKYLHLSSHSVKCQVVEKLRNFRVLANRTLLPSAARQRWWMARLTKLHDLPPISAQSCTPCTYSPIRCTTNPKRLSPVMSSRGYSRVLICGQTYAENNRRTTSTSALKSKNVELHKAVG